MFRKMEQNERKVLISIFVYLIVFSLLSMVLCITLRGYMNIANRIDFISNRLDDYPSIHEKNVKETDEWWNWWQSEDYQKRADQAAFVYTNDHSHPTEQETLDHILKIVDADEVAVIEPSEYDPLHEKYHDAGLNICSSELNDGRLIVLGIHNSLKKDRIAFYQDNNGILSQLEAGMPGHIILYSGGEFTVYPQDELSESVTSEIKQKIENGLLNLEEMKRKAQTASSGTCIDTRNENLIINGTKVQYKLLSAAYRDNDDIVISAVELEDLARFGRKRSWSLWFLSTAIMVLMAFSLWKTRIFNPDFETTETQTDATPSYARVRGLAAFLMSVLLAFMSVIFIQMLSDVNQSAQAAEDEAVYLSNVLKQEAQRCVNITEQFDKLYNMRANSAAEILSENPELIDMDHLRELNKALGASGVRVYSREGDLIASDDVLKNTGRTNEVSAVIHINDKDITGIQTEDDSSYQNGERIYTASLLDENGKTTGFVELDLPESQLEELVKDTRMQEVIGDMHILDTMHIAAIETSDPHRILAGTYPSWIGDPAEEHGIVTNFFTDGYEGIVNFGGSKCYSVVFNYDNRWVVVGSEDVSPMVFIYGVGILFFALLVVLALLYSRLTTVLYRFQKAEAVENSESYLLRLEYPPIWLFVRGFMISVSMLSAVLFLTTNGNPTGLTYNMVRGTWVRGISVVTVTTSVMLVSCVFAAQLLLDIAFGYLSRFLSPKGKTICGLIDSAVTYIGAIVMILYTLMMLGVNTATLIGGAGAAALIFTVGANSLIADVVSGIFIIFEGDYSVGDVVVINDWRGIVTDITMRTTKLMDDNSQDILIISNSEIKALVNQSREISSFIIDFSISHDLGIAKAEEIIREVLGELPQLFPAIIGVPQYLGVAELPSRNSITGKLSGPKLRIAVSCKEMDREMLTYQIHRYLVRIVNILQNDHTDIGVNDPRIPDLVEVNENIVTRADERTPANLDEVVKDLKNEAAASNQE